MIQAAPANVGVASSGCMGLSVSCGKTVAH